MLYKILLHFHSGWAYLTILMGVMFLIIVGFYALNKRARDQFVRKLGLFTIITFHVQLVTGAILYFISPRVESGDTFYVLEHPIMMFTAVLLMTVANSKLKKEKIVGFVTMLLALIAMICLLVMIPWGAWAK
jgi:membrane-associated phospholipid phosphatase